jgi:hypothetical protein
MDDPNKFYPQQPAPDAHRPVLDYRSPQPRPRPSGTRAGSVGKGIAAVWGCVIAAIMWGLGNHGNGFVPVLVLGGIGCVVFAAVDFSNKRQAGFLGGLILGVLTVLGVGALTIAVICGAFR